MNVVVVLRDIEYILMLNSLNIVERDPLFHRNHGRQKQDSHELQVIIE
jgi:hypothetical protein